MATTAINWNATIKFIKMQLGADVNLIEIDDYKIQEIIQEITMPEFCQYINYLDRITFPGEYLIWETENTSSRPRLRIQNYPRQIFEIKTIIFDWRYNSTLVPNADATSSNLVEANYIADMNESLATIRSWNFIRPDIIELHWPYSFNDPEDLIVELGTAFLSPDEIEPSMYIHFRKLAAADVLDYVISLRTKFQSLATPQGQINLDTSRLEQKAERFRSEALQGLQESSPPDKYFWWITP